MTTLPAQASPAAVREAWAAARRAGDQLAVRCVWMRGGTSRGAFLRVEDLPADAAARDRVILAIYGSPDVRQIDGLGGADPLTSKVAVIGPPSRPDADVDYVFGQVRIAEPLVDYRGTCGNLLAAVGSFAIDEGVIPATEPLTRVRIHDVNLRTLVVAEVPVLAGRARTAGDAAVPGVPGTGAPIKLDFSASGPTLRRGLLPTGSPVDELAGADGRRYRASLVDAGNPAVFVLAADFGLDPDALVASRYDAALMRRLEELRGAAAVRLGLVADATRAAAESPTIPKIYLVHPRADYTTPAGRRIGRDRVDLVARGLAMQRLHLAYAATVGIATAAAAHVPGTVVASVLDAPTAPAVVRIGHPGGVLSIEAAVDLRAEGGPRLTRGVIERTARRLMAGEAYVPASVFR